MPLKTLPLTLLCFVASFSWANKYIHFMQNFQVQDYALGGAAVAKGNNTFGLMMNPANLTHLPADYGWDVQLLQLNFAAGESISKFIDDLQDARNTQGSDDAKNLAVIQAIERAKGDNFGYSLQANAFGFAKKIATADNNHPSTAANTSTNNSSTNSGTLGQHWTDNIGFGFLPFVHAEGYLTPHSGFGSAGLVEVNALYYSGIALAFAKDVPLQQKRLSLGLGIKMVQFAGLQQDLTVVQLIDDNLETDLTDKYLSNGSAIVADLGAIYPLLDDDALGAMHVGFAYRNLGGIGETNGIHIPATFDVGLAYFYALSDFNPVDVTLNYYDLFNAYDDANSFTKRLAIGLDLGVFETAFLDLGVQFGMRNTQLSYGAELLFGVLKLGYANYYQELGVYGGQDGERLQQFSLAIAW